MTATAHRTSQVNSRISHYGQISIQNQFASNYYCVQAMTEWTKLFPRQMTETYTSSATFMKKLAVVAVSTIMYVKNVCPEDNYTEDLFGGMKIKVLKSKCTDELAQFVITALTHAFEAFDKKYVSSFGLRILLTLTFFPI